MIWLKLDLRAESKEKCNLCRLCCRVDMSKNGDVALSHDLFKKKKEMHEAVGHVWGGAGRETEKGHIKRRTKCFPLPV